MNTMATRGRLPGAFAAGALLASDLGCLSDPVDRPACDPNAAIASIEPLSELALASSRETDFVLSPTDENLAFFTSVRSDGTGLYTTRRKDRASLFAVPAPLTVVRASAIEQRPIVTADGSELWFTRQVDGRRLVLHASKVGGSTELGPATEVRVTLPDGREATPACPWIDSSRPSPILYFSEVSEVAPPAVGRVFAAPLDGSAPAAEVAELAGYECIVVSIDGTEAFLRKHASGGAAPACADCETPSEVFHSTRDPRATATWSTPSAVSELRASAASTTVTYVSRNHCDVYLASNRDGAARIYWGKRTPR